MEKKQVTAYLPKPLGDKLENEKKLSGHNANSIIIIALDEYLKKKDRERK